MSCNHCSTASTAPAAGAGAPDIEANWAAHREHPQYCPACHAFLRADGGCTKCEGTGVTSDGETMPDLNTLPAAARRYLTGPVVRPAKTGWPLPDWMEPAIRAARQEQVWAEVAAGEVGDKATPVEACAYLHEASLMQPLNRDWADIFIHVSAQAMKGRLPPAQNLWEMLGREPVERLSADQQRELDDLLRKLRQKTSEPGKSPAGRGKKRDETLAMAGVSAGEYPQMRLSCGHAKQTRVSPGSEEWCTECDDWATVEAPGGPTLPPPPPAVTPATPPRASALSEPPAHWSFRRKQLWKEMEKQANLLGINRVEDDWTGFAFSEGKGYGKVYGGFYGEGSDGKWYSVTAYGPVEKAKVQSVTAFGSQAGAKINYQNTRRSKLTGKYSEDWPCDHR